MLDILGCNAIYRLVMIRILKIMIGKNQLPWVSDVTLQSSVCKFNF